jgi:hypothetical protein
MELHIGTNESVTGTFTGSARVICELLGIRQFNVEGYSHTFNVDMPDHFYIKTLNIPNDLKRGMRVSLDYSLAIPGIIRGSFSNLQITYMNRKKGIVHLKRIEEKAKSPRVIVRARAGPKRGKKGV